MLGSLSGIAAFVVLLVNVALRPIIGKLTDFERHSTFTEKNVSIAIKLTLARVINSSVIFLIVHGDSSEDWHEIGYLAYGATLLIAGMLVIPPTLYLIDIPRCRKTLRKRIEMAKGAKSQLTQKEANFLCEGS